MENNKKYVDLSTVDLTGKHICDINYKPNSTLIGAFIFAAIMIITMNIYCIIIGVFVLAYAAFVTKTVNDYRTLSIYDTFVLISELDNSNNVRKINYDDIEEWTCKNNDGKANCVMFKLKDGEVIYKDTFQFGKAFAELNKLMPAKESMAIKKERQRKVQMKFKFRLPKFFNKK